MLALAACRLAIDPPWVTALVAALVRTRVADLTPQPTLRRGVKHFIGILRKAYAARERYALVVEASHRNGSRLCLSLTGHNQSEGTAVAAALIADALDRGDVERAGVWFAEQVIAVEPFFAALRGRALAVTTGDLGETDESLAPDARRTPIPVSSKPGADRGADDRDVAHRAGAGRMGFV